MSLATSIAATTCRASTTRHSVDWAPRQLIWRWRSRTHFDSPNRCSPRCQLREAVTTFAIRISIMRLLLETHYAGSFDDTSDMTHVLVELDRKIRLDMKARLSDVLAMAEMYSVTFFDWAPVPVSIGI